MAEKYDLIRMLIEIKEDEEVDSKKDRRVSQDDIRKLLKEKQKRRKERS